LPPSRQRHCSHRAPLPGREGRALGGGRKRLRRDPGDRNDFYYSHHDQHAAYESLRADNPRPSYAEIADEQDPLCRVKLFQPGSRFAYYVCAATEYDGIEGLVLTGYCVSPLGRDCDEFGDQGLAEIARVRVGGLPPERCGVDRVAREPLPDGRNRSPCTDV
jgi:hypothetical protein